MTSQTSQTSQTSHNLGGFGRNQITPDYINPVHWRYATPESFRRSIEHARGHMTNRQSLCVSTFSTAEYRHAQLYLSHDNCSGYAIFAGGELRSVFSCVKGRGAQLLDSAIANGATWLECFDGFLSQLYSNAGFVEVARYTFDPALAPTGWDQLANGTPDYLKMVLQPKPANALVNQPQPVPFDSLGFVIRFEGDGFDDEQDIIDGFQHLIDNKLVWQLQGSYGRMARQLIIGGYCHE